MGLLWKKSLNHFEGLCKSSNDAINGSNGLIFSQRALNMFHLIFVENFHLKRLKKFQESLLNMLFFICLKALIEIPINIWKIAQNKSALTDWLLDLSGEGYKSNKSPGFLVHYTGLQDLDRKCHLFRFWRIPTNFWSLNPNPKSVFGYRVWILHCCQVCVF